MTEMFLGLSPDTDKCDPELIRERIKEIEGYIISLQSGESFFESKESLIIRTDVEEADDDDGMNCRTVSVVREEGGDRKGWLIITRGDHVSVVGELIGSKDDDDKREVYLLFSSEINPDQSADCSNYDSLERLAGSLAQVSGTNRPSRNPFAVEKNSQ